MASRLVDARLTAGLLDRLQVLEARMDAFERTRGSGDGPCVSARGRLRDADDLRVYVALTASFDRMAEGAPVVRP